MGIIKKVQFVKSLKVGDRVDTLLAVREKNLQQYSKPSRAGEKFLRVFLSDTSGTITGVLWDNAQEVSQIFKVGEVVHVTGQVTDYRGLQITIETLKKVNMKNIDPTYFQEVVKKSRREMMEKVKSHINTYVNDPYLCRLLQEFLDDRDFNSQFIKAPGGRLIHHNYVGGLLEHSLEVMEICIQLLHLYPKYMNSSLLISGAVLHDIGKIKEYDMNSILFQYTDRGKLIGHITMGRDMVMKKANKYKHFPEDIKLELEHMILSHHGKKEWGSPEIPRTINAFALFHADLVSARMNQFTGVIQQSLENEQPWSDWNRFLERDVFIPNYLKEDRDTSHE
ncbi:3'-5' exoribonuclease YhaM family protein [Candidatus Contubernalis alkaliaceticus]|uniref:3'-5' exoribonuclease YhaM family protein n=1 Tax=Candidatus Contubernalis alkaliaceticus TaxID=338645 RepID=UPI001F4C2DC4|nr:HD domain-containing protein [Candidatus Contubernalis alkalaceticus]UNC93373.1 HD domain-containing protein [Candidatus Contubernalis alkalaceticus]